VLDVLSGYPGHDFAGYQQPNGLLLHYRGGRPPYNREEVQTLPLAMRARKARLVAKDGRIVPAEAEWVFTPHTGILEVKGSARPSDPEYPDPHIEVLQMPAVVTSRSATAAPGDRPGRESYGAVRIRLVAAHSKLAKELGAIEERYRKAGKTRGLKTEQAELLMKEARCSKTSAMNFLNSPED
jgi:hypothetical protein